MYRPPRLPATQPTPQLLRSVAPVDPTAPPGQPPKVPDILPSQVTKMEAEEREKKKVHYKVHKTLENLGMEVDSRGDHCCDDNECEGAHVDDDGEVGQVVFVIALQLSDASGERQPPF